SVVEVIKNKQEAILSNEHGKVSFDLLNGKLIEYKKDNEKILIKGPELTFWRAPIDNDMYQLKPWKEEFFLHLITEMLLDVKITETNNFVEVEFMKHVSTANQAWGFEVRYTYKFDQFGDLRIDIKGDTIIRGTELPQMLPRIGVEMRTPKEFKDVRWFGNGPHESYVDSQSSVHLGLYQKTVDEMHTEYIYPQENGART